jgi:hypothetical protein
MDRFIREQKVVQSRRRDDLDVFTYFCNEFVGEAQEGCHFVTCVGDRAVLKGAIATG